MPAGQDWPGCLEIKKVWLPALLKAFPLHVLKLENSLWSTLPINWHIFCLSPRVFFFQLVAFFYEETGNLCSDATLLLARYILQCLKYRPRTKNAWYQTCGSHIHIVQKRNLESWDPAGQKVIALCTFFFFFFSMGIHLLHQKIKLSYMKLSSAFIKSNQSLPLQAGGVEWSETTQRKGFLLSAKTVTVCLFVLVWTCVF